MIKTFSIVKSTFFFNHTIISTSNTVNVSKMATVLNSL